MIVDQLYIPGIFTLPPEAHPILIVHANAVLASPVAPQLFQAISRGIPQILQRCCEINGFDFSSRCSGEVPEFPASRSEIQLVRFLICERPDHRSIVPRFPLNETR